MGEVWLASPWGLPGNQDDLCIVKRVKSTLTTDDDTVRRFVDESRLGLLLRHPTVCRTLDAGRVDGSDYLAVELVEGVAAALVVDEVVLVDVHHAAPRTLILASRLHARPSPASAWRSSSSRFHTSTGGAQPLPMRRCHSRSQPRYSMR